MVDATDGRKIKGGMNMKIFKMLKHRYADMGSLFWVVWIVLLGVIAFHIFSVIDLMRTGSNERMLGWIYICNMLALLVLCVNILRMDCRNLLSHKTAGLLETSGYFIILIMLIRNVIAREAGEVGEYADYSLDWTTLMLFGFLLQFVGKIVHRAVKLKEEQDLTI